MINELLIQNKGKTLEFKECTTSLQKIIQTIVAFANTAGGSLIIGIADKTKEVVGLGDVLQEEEKLASAVADSVFPQIFPSFLFYTLQSRDLLIVSVPHRFGPFYIKAKGMSGGTYVRLGSMNRLADS
ncbi:MAG: ATP-binding protein [bacterium]